MPFLRKLIATSALAAGAAVAQPGPLTADLVRSGGVKTGSVSLQDGKRGVLVRIDAVGLAPGWHAVHFHEKANCSDLGFKASGGHVHGGKRPVHGLLNPGGNEWGDLPNIHVDENGRARAELFSSFASLKGGAGRARLQDKDGSALIIHAKADDHLTQPIGGAGDRVACALIL